MDKGAQTNLGSKMTVVQNKPKPIKAGGKGSPLLKIVAVIVVIIILAGAVIAFYPSGVSTISTNKTLSLSPDQGAYFKVAGSSSESTILLSSSTNSSALFYMSSVPVLLMPAYTFTLYPGAIVNLSTTGSDTADLQAKLISTSTGGVMLQLTAIPMDFGVKVSSTVSVLQTGSAASTSASTSTTTTTSTATTSTSSTTNTTTKTNTTTTKNTTQTQLLSNAQVLVIANTTAQGELMNEYDALFVKDAGCSSSTYNTTYQVVIGTAPSPPNTYGQQLNVTPTSISTSVYHGKDYDYEVIYTANARLSEYSVPIMDLWLNTQSSSPVINDTIISFEGQSNLDFSDLNESYPIVESIQSDCGAYIP